MLSLPIDRRRALTLLAGAIPASGSAVAWGQEPVPPAPRPAARPGVAPAPTIPLSISWETAEKVGRQVWQNESGRSIPGLTVWNDGEDFPSLGIGHWIWFKAGGHPIFEESFPKLIGFMRERGARPPAWLDKDRVPPCPWQSKTEFLRSFNDPPLAELRQFLVRTIPLQTQYLLERTKAAESRMLAVLAERPDERRHLLAQLERVVASSPDLYPLIDYVNFKGEGISEKETRYDPPSRESKGWGLRWLLLEMRGTERGTPALEEFARSAKAVLDRRIRNHSPSARWQLGWHKRCDTYRRPLA